MILQTFIGYCLIAIGTYLALWHGSEFIRAWREQKRKDRE